MEEEEEEEKKEVEEMEEEEEENEVVEKETEEEEEEKEVEEKEEEEEEKEVEEKEEDEEEQVKEVKVEKEDEEEEEEEEKEEEKEKVEEADEEEEEEEVDEEEEEDEDAEESEKEAEVSAEDETKIEKEDEESDEEEEEKSVSDEEEHEETEDIKHDKSEQDVEDESQFIEEHKKSKIVIENLTQPPAGNETSTGKEFFKRLHGEEASEEAYIIGAGMAHELPPKESLVEQPSTSETTEGEEEEAQQGEEIDEDEEEKEEEEEEEEEEIKQPKLPLRSREHIDEILGLNEIGTEYDQEDQKFVQGILNDMKKIYENAIKPLEMIYKFRDISTRLLGDAEVYAKPMVLFVGPWSSGKSSVINYLLNTERTSAALKTGPEPTDVDFTIISYGEEPLTKTGGEMITDWAYSSVQKFGQGFLEHFKGIQYPHRLLQKLTLVDTPGIMETKKPEDRGYPFNDAFQWFIDRADAIYIVLDPGKLDIGSELESLLDQLKGREAQIRFVLNKADIIRRNDVMKVIGQLFWNLSPLMGSSEAPVIYAVSLMTKPFHPGSPAKFLLDQEMTLLSDLRETMDRKVENRILFARRHAVRVRNHAKMVDCYLSTYYKHKSIFSNRKKVAEQITENPNRYSIYQGLSTLTNVSRYDLPDPDIYREFFNLHPLYDFKPLQSTCSYFRGCPLDKLDLAISYDLPDLLGKYKKHFNKPNNADHKEDDKSR